MHSRTDLARLRDVGWLGATPSAFCDAVLARCHLRQVDKGAWVYRVGEQGDGLWGVVSGGLHVEFTQGYGAPGTGIFASTGFWVGEGSLLAREPRAVGLQATRPSVMAHLPRNAFLAIAAEDAEAWRWVGLLAFFHMRDIIALREDLCVRDPERRLIATILRMTGSHWGGPALDYASTVTEWDIDLSQGDLADLANVSRSLLARVLAALRSEGLIDTGYASIRILDVEGLRTRLDRPGRRGAAG